jgi:hypothetical protein
MMDNEENRRAIAKAISELSPERKRDLNSIFSDMRESEEHLQPMMRQTHFGGECNFDVNRKQVELNGVFSKADLLRIAMILE